MVFICENGISSDGVFDLRLSTSKKLGSAGEKCSNYEQLFAAGYYACFIGALNFLPDKKKLFCRKIYRSKEMLELELFIVDLV